MENLERKETKQVITKEIVFEYLKNFGFMKNLTQQQAEQFAIVCKTLNLNPIKREAYAISYNGQFSIVVDYETYLKRAEETGLLDGWKCEAVYDNGNLIGAKCVIYRKDWKYPFEHSVSLKEYNRNMALWKDKPETMIKKVCIAQAFRMCFSSELQGMPYTQEEQESSGIINLSDEKEQETIIKEQESTQENKTNLDYSGRKPSKKQLDYLIALMEKNKNNKELIKEVAKIAKIKFVNGKIIVDGDSKDVSKAIDMLNSSKFISTQEQANEQN